MAIKKAKNKAITEGSKNVTDKAFTFPGSNPPVTVYARNHKDALEKFKKLSTKK